jgi:uncharacterized protein (DUF934 family)
MKITLKIPGRTLHMAKAAACAQGIPLHDFITQAIEEKRSRSRRQQAKPWLECAGELAHLHQETNRLQSIIDEEFRQL